MSVFNHDTNPYHRGPGLSMFRPRHDDDRVYPGGNTYAFCRLAKRINKLTAIFKEKKLHDGNI